MKSGASLDAQIASLALRLERSRTALRCDYALVQVHARKLIFTPPVLAVGLTVLLLLAWRKSRH